MSKSSGNPSLTAVLLAVAALLLIVIFYFGFRGEEEVEPGRSQPAAASPAADRTNVAKQSPDREQPRPTRAAAAPIPRDPADPSARTPAGADDAMTEPLQEDMPEAMYREFEDAPGRPIPEVVLRDFEDALREIPEDELLRLEANANAEVDQRKLQEVEAAALREMPTDLRQAFENPYVEIPEAELEVLRQNGRVGQQ